MAPAIAVLRRARRPAHRADRRGRPAGVAGRGLRRPGGPLPPRDRAAPRRVPRAAPAAGLRAHPADLRTAVAARGRPLGPAGSPDRGAGRPRRHRRGVRRVRRHSRRRAALPPCSPSSGGPSNPSTQPCPDNPRPRTRTPDGDPALPARPGRRCAGDGSSSSSGSSYSSALGLAAATLRGPTASNFTMPGTESPAGARPAGRAVPGGQRRHRHHRGQGAGGRPTGHARRGRPWSELVPGGRHPARRGRRGRPVTRSARSPPTAGTR